MFVNGLNADSAQERFDLEGGGGEIVFDGVVELEGALPVGERLVDEGSADFEIVSGGSQEIDLEAFPDALLAGLCLEIHSLGGDSAGLNLNFEVGSLAGLNLIDAYDDWKGYRWRCWARKRRRSQKGS